MRIKVRVTPNARQAQVTKVDEDNFEVKVDRKAEGGLANKRLMELLSDYFNVPKAKISILSGMKSRDKVIEL